MALRNEYKVTIEKFRMLSIEEQNDMLRDVTANQMTGDLEDVVLNISSIPGVGKVTARAIMFAIGINL